MTRFFDEPGTSPTDPQDRNQDREISALRELVSGADLTSDHAGSTDPADTDVDNLPRPAPEDDPTLPSYHWHSVAAGRGWEQPMLDGGHGGVDPHVWLWRHQQEHHHQHRPRLDATDTTPRAPRGRTP